MQKKENIPEEQIGSEYTNNPMIRKENNFAAKHWNEENITEKQNG